MDSISAGQSVLVSATQLQVLDRSGGVADSLHASGSARTVNFACHPVSGHAPRRRLRYDLEKRCGVVVRALVCSLVVSSFPVSAYPQGPDNTESASSPDSTGAAAALHGRAAADRVRVSGSFLSGFVGGTLIGGGVTLYAIDRDTYPISLLISGSGIAISVTTFGDTRRSGTSGASMPSSDYQRSYADRLNKRKRQAFGAGMFSGSLAGSALMYFFISKLLAT